MEILYLKTVDGSELDDKKILKWLYFSKDTSYVKEWYKNSDGYFVKLYNREDFMKIKVDLL